jgi:excisionase family DNA binding protein
MAEPKKASREMAEMAAEFLELEAHVAREMARARVMLAAASDAVARAEAEATRRRELNFYTEDEAAAKMKISKDSLERLRKNHDLPHTRLGALVRYTDEQLIEAARILERPRRQRPAAVKRQAA